MRAHTSDIASSGSQAALQALALGLLGLAILAWMMLSAPPVGALQAAGPTQNASDQGMKAAQPTHIGVVIAPWADGGLGAAATFDLPIIAMRWGGHLAVLDISHNPSAGVRLRAAGYLIINTSTFSGCMVKGTPDA